MFIKWGGIEKYNNYDDITTVISNLKWNNIHISIQINNTQVYFIVKYYIRDAGDIIYIWERLKEYVKKEYSSYIDNNILKKQYYTCEHCQFNNQYNIYIDDVIEGGDIGCSCCNTRIYNKLIRTHENSTYHINCFNRNSEKLLNNKNPLLQCNMCNKYLRNTMIYGKEISNKYIIFKYIQESEINNYYMYVRGNEYCLLFVTK